MIVGVSRFWLLPGIILCWSAAGGDARAAVQVLTDAAMTVDGRPVAGHRVMVAHPALKEVLAAFELAETALQKKDLQALMGFYAPAYNYHGLHRADVQRVWGEVFEHYRDVSSTHLFSEVHISQTSAGLRAEVTCTGGLYGTDRQTGKPVTLDSWFREVHYLVKEQGGWRFLGNKGDVPKIAPFSSAPHHPLF